MSGIVTIILAIAITLASTSARVITQNTLATALQDILSPTNTNEALKLIQLAAKRANKMPELIKILGCNEQFLPAGVNNRELPARNIYTNDLPVRIINANELPRRTIYELPAREICGNELPVCTLNEARTIYGKDLPGCAICANKLPGRKIYANELPIQRKLTREMPVRNVPESCVCQENDLNQAKNLIQPSLMDSLLFPKEMFVPFSPVQEVRKEIGGYPFLMNPFLPAASPVSAKTSCFPPPTQSKGQFLRKIPIPPPTL